MAANQYGREEREARIINRLGDVLNAHDIGDEVYGAHIRIVEVEELIETYKMRITHRDFALRCEVHRDDGCTVLWDCKFTGDIGEFENWVIALKLCYPAPEQQLPEE